MPEPHVYRPYQSTSGPHDGHTITFANIELWQDELPDALDIGGHLWVRERTCTMEPDGYYGEEYGIYDGRSCHHVLSRRDDCEVGQ